MEKEIMPQDVMDADIRGGILLRSVWEFSEKNM